MQVKTILNRIQKQRGFVYGDVRLEDLLDGLALTVDLYPMHGIGCSAPAVDTGGPSTTAWRLVALSSCRSGTCASSSWT